MLGILVSWCLLFFVFVSFGSMLLKFQNFFCEKDEINEHSTIDLVLLGICILFILLSVVSLFLPCNEFVLLGAIVVSVTYWGLFPKERSNYVKTLRSTFAILSKGQIFLLLAFFSSFLLLAIWIPNVEYDPRYYHYQNIVFIEEYKIIPGLANLEDRFGFNSNYFLISAVFTLRSVFGSPIYGFQSFVFVLVGLWLLKEVFVSKFKLEKLLSFSFFIPLYFVFLVPMSDTSTDILPSVIVFYLVVKLLSNPKFEKQQLLLYTFVPVCLVTLKLSLAIFSLIVLPVLWMLYKQNDTKRLIFIISISTAVICLWLTRNVIISGYLIYPFHEIDIFSVDWKIPKEIAIVQRTFIKDAGDFVLNLYSYHMPIPHLTTTWKMNQVAVPAVLILLCFLSVLVNLFNLYIAKIHKVKTGFLEMSALILTLYLNFACWLVSAPTFRFIAGVVCGILLVSTYCLCKLIVRDKLAVPVGIKQFGVSCLVLMVVLPLSFWANYNTVVFYKKALSSNSTSTILLRPLSFLFDVEDCSSLVAKYEERYVGNVVVYMKPLNTINEHILLDKFPSAVYMNPESPKVDHGRIMDISSVDSRGTTITDGFKPKDNMPLKFKKELKIIPLSWN